MDALTSSHTYQEIVRQPAVWRELADQLAADSERVATFLGPLLADPALRIVLTGAGSSAFIGEIAAPALARATSRRVEAIPTTDLVSNPEDYLAEDLPTLLVSFARSGSSPESLAATEIADALLTRCHHLVITCSAKGRLATAHRDREGSLVVLMPAAAEDQGFAMTSAVSSMLLTVLALLGPRGPQLVEPLAAAADQALAARAEDIAALAARDPQRVVYLGSGPLKGLAQESALKLLELVAGDRIALHESSLGFRHGPKAVLDASTLVIVFISSDPYTRRYDLDIVEELRGDLGPDAVVAVAASPVPVDDAWVWEGLDGAEDAEAAAVHLLLPQLLAAHLSHLLGKPVDNPFPSGTVNRVVQGVVIHPLAAPAPAGADTGIPPLESGAPMPSRTVTVASSVGLHARPATLLAQAAAATGLPVLIAKGDGAPVDARSMLGIMALGAGHGDEVTISAEGEGADAALDELAAMLERDLDAG